MYNLKKHYNITILPADGGNVTLILDKAEYNNKLEDVKTSH